MGVHPPLELSHSLVQFGATALGDQSTAILQLINRPTDRNQSKQPVTPVMKDGMSVGVPRLFSFVLPEDSDISITPTAGRLLPGEVEYTPHVYTHCIHLTCKEQITNVGGVEIATHCLLWLWRVLTD